MYMYLCVYIYKCIFNIFIASTRGQQSVCAEREYRKTDRLIDRQADRQTDRQTDSQAGR